MAAPYVPLWVKSNYSFLEGASHPSELVDQAHRFGLDALALTDRDGIYGLVRAHVRAKELGLRVLPGAQVTVGQDLCTAHTVVLLPQSRTGYGQLTQLLSLGHNRAPKGQSLVHLDELCTLASDLLLLCPEPKLLAQLKDGFAARLYALIARHHHAHEQIREHELRTQANSLQIPTVAAVEVLYHCPRRRPVQDVLTCIRAGTSLSAAGTRLRGNAEHALPSIAVMQHRFADDPGALERTREVAHRCNFDLDRLRYHYPSSPGPEGMSQSQWLHHKTMNGATRRYGETIPQQVVHQLQRELCLIDELDYGGYFLTMAEIVEYCQSEGIACQGRGSAANSAVCYCLGITAIDPVHMDLLFERFLSRERAEPPDIDLDIEHERREQVIQWVYRKFGRRHAAMIANVVRYRGRSAIREVGKVLDIPEVTLDRLAKQLGYADRSNDVLTLGHLELDPQAPALRHLLSLASTLEDFPRHLSIHPGGFLLSCDPIDTLVPIEPATMALRSVVQWDKYDIEDLGLFKVDLLGLGALTMIRKAFELLHRHEGVQLSMATIEADDPATYAMISRADTVGVFQIESRAQMAMLPRLQPRQFYDLVVEVALVRPGPIQGDMVHPYLRRRTGQEPVHYPHPLLERALAKTLGVPIFQEQVMKLAVLVADYTPGEADQLRRDMAAWRNEGRIEQHRERLIRRMVDNGIPLEFAERIFSQIRGFGDYGFPESHAASFALLAYVTAWLRCHHLPAFVTALLNAQPMGFYSPATLIEDAKRHGVEVRPIDINHSDWDCDLESTGPGRWAIRMGLRYLRGFGQREHAALPHLHALAASRTCDARPQPYADLADLVARTRLNRKALHTLAEAGALASFGLGRREALWALKGLLATQQDRLPLPSDSDNSSLAFAPLAPGQAILWDYRTSMHSTRGHPMEQVRPSLRARGLPTAEEVAALTDGQRVEYAGLVICRQRPQSASEVTFYTLEDETGFVNVVVWRQVFARDRLLAKAAIVLGVYGRMQVQAQVRHVVAQGLWDPTVALGEGRFEVHSFR